MSSSGYIDINKTVMQQSEVSNIRFVNKTGYLDLLNEGKMVEEIKLCGKLLNHLK